MNKKISVISIIFFIIFLFCTFVITYTPKQNNTVITNEKEWRIASFSPVITEFLYAAALGDNVSVNTTFCNYPPEASLKPKLGSHSNINYEYILLLGVNAAVIHKGSNKEKEILNNLGIKTIEIDTNTISSILEAFDKIGHFFGTEVASNNAKNKIITEINKYSTFKNKNKKPKVLTVIFRPEGTKGIQKVTAAGSNGIYNDILTFLGAENALKDTRPYPEISQEGIININPDIIIEISYNNSNGTIDDWNNLKKTVAAVKNGCVYLTDDPVMSLPGPRLPFIIKYFADSIYGNEKCLK